MQDLKGNHKIVGGAILLLSGKFRQILTTTHRSTFTDEINACLIHNHSYDEVLKNFD